MTALEQAGRSGGWTRAERLRLTGIVGAVAGLHVAGISLYLAYRGNITGAGGVAGAGAMAYVLGMRHAFDADHLAAIDDTTRVMLLRGRRPVGVGFFFAMGHSTVVVALALLVATAASSLSDSGVESLRSVGGTLAVVVAVLFLGLVAALNAKVLATLVRLRRRLRQGGRDAAADVESALLSRGVLNRLMGGRLRGLIRHSWHMYPVGLLMGLGLETASEVTLLALSASSAAGGRLPLVAVLSLPLLFAAGMSMFDTADSLLMTRIYSWSYRDPDRALAFNIATTAMTVLIGGFVASVYLASLLADHAGVAALAPLASVGDHFELLGFGIAGAFVLTWVGALVVWRWGRHAR